jgi:hypothetical protein
MHFFDYEKVAREAGIPSDALAELCRVMRAEFPRDEMMYELHVLRACLAIEDGIVRLEDVQDPVASEREDG